jgi:hypothetical protein
MNLQTLSYAPEPSSEMADPLIGLPDLRKGLHTILLGYLLSMAALVGAGAVVAYVVLGLGRSPSGKAMESASTILFAVVLLTGLALLASMWMIVRGKWMCVLSAPEHYHAKWLMFLSIFCVLTSPALNIASSILGDDAKTGARVSASKRTSDALLREIEEYKRVPTELGTRGYIKLAGSGAGLLSGVFFVLFLRALALCWGAQGRARAAECYLIFVGLLVAAIAVLVKNPAVLRTQPLLLPALGGGWLLAGLWYLGLILSSSAGISNILANPPKSLL